MFLWFAGDMLRSAVFDCTHVSALDYSAVQCIQTLVDDFKAKNAIFVIACANVSHFMYILFFIKIIWKTKIVNWAK